MYRKAWPVYLINEQDIFISKVCVYLHTVSEKHAYFFGLISKKKKNYKFSLLVLTINRVF